MSSAAEVLVIIVSIVLTVFLIVSIILGIYLIKLSAELRRVTHSVQETAEQIEATAKTLRKAASPLFFAEVLKGIAKKYTKGRKKDDE